MIVGDLVVGAGKRVDPAIYEADEVLDFGPLLRLRLPDQPANDPNMLRTR
jgi:hypothetical protein